MATGGRGLDRHDSADIRNFCVSRATPCGASDPTPVLARTRARARPQFEAALSRNAADSANRAPRPSKANASTAARISLPSPRPWNARPSQDPVSTVRWTGEGVTHHALGADGAAVHLDHQVQAPVVDRPRRSTSPVVGEEAVVERRLGRRHQATPNGISSGGWMPALATPSSATRSSSVGRRRTRCSRPYPQLEERPDAASGATEGSTAAMGTRRYTPAMGAVETMEEFFEKLNAGDREGAVAMMDEKTEMRVHVGDNVQTLRGVERVGGWFLRGDAGLRMIPGDIRDTGNTYEADLLVVRPGAPTQHIDATFRVEAGRITAINIAPR